MPFVALILVYVAVIAVLGMVPLLLWTGNAARSRRATMVVSYLEQAVRLNLPLHRMLEAATASESGAMSLRLAEVRALLAQGLPVGEALNAAVPELPRRQASIIAAAERIGQLPRGLHSVMRERQLRLQRPALDDWTFYRAYPLVMIVTLTAVIGVVSVFILPKFEQIFRDFGTPLPALTVTVFSLANGHVGQVLLLVIACFVVTVSIVSLLQFTGILRGLGQYWRHPRDWMAWHLPVLHGVERDRGLADAFDLLAEALANATPVDRAFAEASGLAVNIVLRRRLWKWAQAVSAGESLAAGARSASMPPLVVGMLSNASHDGSAPEVFAFLARYYRTRFSRTAAIVQSAMVPLVTLFFAFLTAAVALAMFLPLIALINGIIDSPTVRGRL